MSDRTRYQAQSVYRESPVCTSYRGVDPLTGLPVLIYRFKGKANPALPRLDNEFIPRLLAWRDDDGQGVMVVAWSSAFVAAGDQQLDHLQLLDSAQALAAAAAAGVSHGDLTPERFLIAGDSVVLEGFGVPWHTTPATPEGDVRDWAASLRQLGYPSVNGLDALLDSLSGSGDTTPAQLVSRLRNVLLRSGGEEPAPAEPVAAAEPEPEAGEPLAGFFGSDAEDPDADDLDFSSHSSLPAAAPPQAAAAPDDSPADQDNSPAQPDLQPDDDAADDDGTFRPSSTFASERLTARPAPAQPLPAGGSSSYLKALDPVEQPGADRGGTDYGQEGGPSVTTRRIIMVGALLVLLAVFAFLMINMRRQEAPPAPEPLAESVTYVIDVLVEPSDLPPVNLYVLESPPASGLRPNTILGTAPRRMALDAAGTWVFEGRFQGRTSAPVTINIPEDRASAVTIVIPPAEPAED